MTRIRVAADAFLEQRRIAVTGVSRTPETHGSNIVYRRLRDEGYEVFAVNPNAEQVEGDRCYPSLSAVPGGVDAVVIATRADRALDAVRECDALGIRFVWMHRAFGAGSVSKDAAELARSRGMSVIDGGCPLMFLPGDPGHKVLRTLLTATRKVPVKV